MIQTNLKELLNRNNISINKLSIETGLSRPTLTSLMNNESKGIQFDTLEKLLDYFNISISDFFSVYNEEIIFNFLSEVPLSKVKIMEESPLSVERNDNYVEFNPSELISYKCCIEIDGKSGKPFGGALSPVMDNEKIVAMGLVFFRSDMEGNPLPIQDVKIFIKKLDSEALGSLVEKILNNWYKRYKIIKKSDFSDMIITNLTLLDEQPISYPIFIDIEKKGKEIIFDLYGYKNSGYKEGDEDFSNSVIFNDLEG